MKKPIIFLIILLLSISIAFAEGLIVKVIETDTTTNIARIQIANKGTEAYHNVSMSIDGGRLMKLAGVIRGNTGIIKTVKLSPERHTVTLITNEGVFTKQIMGSKPKDVVKQELKAKPPPPGTRQLPKAPEKPGTGSTVVIFFSVIVFLILILTAVVLLKKLKKPAKLPRPYATPLRRPFPKIMPQARTAPLKFQPRKIPMPAKSPEQKIIQKLPEEKIIQKKPEPEIHPALAELEKIKHPKPKTKADVFKKLQRVTNKGVISEPKKLKSTQPKTKADVFKKLQRVTKKDSISELRKLKAKK